MQRRRLLKLGLGGAAFLTLAGGGLAFLKPGLQDGRLTPAARTLFRAVASAVLDGSLPGEDPGRRMALEGCLYRLEQSVAGLPPAVRRELSELITVLGTAPGRFLLAGLRSEWSTVETAEVQAALQTMRLSSLSLRQQAFHALRELTTAAYFADAATWTGLGYPGPRALS